MALNLVGREIDRGLGWGLSARGVVGRLGITKLGEASDVGVTLAEAVVHVGVTLVESVVKERLRSRDKNLSRTSSNFLLRTVLNLLGSVPDVFKAKALETSNFSPVVHASGLIKTS